MNDDVIHSELSLMFNDSFLIWIVLPSDWSGTIERNLIKIQNVLNSENEYPVGEMVCLYSSHTFKSTAKAWVSLIENTFGSDWSFFFFIYSKTYIEKRVESA